MVAPLPAISGDHRDFGAFALVVLSHATPDFRFATMRKRKSSSTRYKRNGHSHGRIPAILHRVTDVEGVSLWTAAVLFFAPKKADTPSEQNHSLPRVKQQITRLYVLGIRAGQLRGKMCRKCQKREFGKVLEENEILATSLRTQDTVVCSDRKSVV